MSLAARTARNTALVVAARLVSKIFVFVVVLVVIRSMGQENYGRFTSLVVYAALVSIALDLGLRPLFTREVAKDRTRLTPYLNSILSLKLTLMVPVLGILFAAVAVGLPSLVPYVIPTFALLVATSFANQLRAAFYAMGQLRYEGIAIIGESLVLLVAAVSVALLRLPWWYFIWAYAASYTFTMVYAAVVAIRRFDHRFAFDLQWVRLSMLARESLPFGLTFIISTLYFKIDVPILKFFTTFAAVGIYSAAYKYLEAVVFMPQTLMDPVFPALSQIAHENIDRLRGAAPKAPQKPRGRRDQGLQDAGFCRDPGDGRDGGAGGPHHPLHHPRLRAGDPRAPGAGAGHPLPLRQQRVPLHSERDGAPARLHPAGRHEPRREPGFELHPDPPPQYDLWRLHGRRVGHGADRGGFVRGRLVPAAEASLRAAHPLQPEGDPPCRCPVWGGDGGDRPGTRLESCQLRHRADRRRCRVRRRPVRDACLHA